jgi:2-aminoadipate transaminase
LDWIIVGTNMSTLNLGSEIAHLKRSDMRKLISLTAAPDVISLAAGLPSGEHIPVDEIKECIGSVLERDGARALQYGPQYEPLVSWITEFMNRRKVRCEPGQVLITNGAQQGLAIISRLFLNQGDVAVTEEVTFTGIQQVTAGRGAVVRPIPTHMSTGADMDALEDELRKEPRPRLVVLIPDFHNPLGVSISAEKRIRAAHLAAEYDVPLIEDDPYSQLCFDGEAPLPIAAHDEKGRVFYVGSFSKMLAPAVRLGWIVAPVDLMPMLVALRESLDLETSALMQRSVAEYLHRGLLGPHLKELNATHRARCHAMQLALEEHMHDLATWTRPRGGLFVWVVLNESIDGRELFAKAIEQKIAFIPGDAFAVAGGHRNTMRLSYCNKSADEIHEVISRLARIVREQM